MANLQRVKDIAERRRISIRELADRVGVKENQIHVMCRTNSTKIDTLEKIAQVLDVSISAFFEDAPNLKNYIEGDNNQLNEQGAHGNINGGDADGVLLERIKSLEALVKEKDERINDLKERIEELKTK